ncbi:hypothetical protein P3X46_014025 [Hevea brasiliensis]|uniref:Malate dehydrogenase n=1 Tax=Hevea brasiliensis TaxID=3981 RepID=A0ABQ9M5B5_HEVBR|nr:hypothetical protein P3X46_014025 [Hevea brasiliensis]
MAVSELTSPAPAYTHTTTHLRSSSQLSLSFTHLSLRFPRAFRPRSTTMTCSVNQVQAPVSVQNQEPKDKSDCFGEEGTKSWKKLINVAVSGAAGMISNHLLFKLASGEVFGPDQPIALKLLGSERSFQALEGVAMEVEDSLYPLLREVSIGINPHEVFEDPQGPGMERADLLDINGQIFAEQSLLLNYSLGSKCNAVASCNVKVIVVGNPCKFVTPRPLGALVRLEPLITMNMTIWGNHSTTQVYANGNPYGIGEDLVFSMPCRSKGDGDYELVKDVIFDDYLRKKITEAELLAEKSCVAHLIGEGVGFCDQITEDTMLPGET